MILAAAVFALARLLSRRGRSLLRVGLVVAMFVLLVAQLTWWLIFFRSNQNEALQVQRRLDALEESYANREPPPYDLRAGLAYRDGRWVVSRARIEARRSKRRRQLAMLVTETLFVICVLVYGSYRVLRSLSDELALIRERNVFLDSVSHELKTPLAGLRLNLQTLLRRRLPLEQERELLRNALADAGRLQEQLGNLLTSAALMRASHAGRAGPDSFCDLTDVTDRVVSDLRNENGKPSDPPHPQPQLVFRGAEPAPVRLREDLAAALVKNLVRNAVLYAVGSGEIQIEVSVGRREVLLRVLDRGPGIPAEERERIFEPLYRVPGGSDPFRGTGMGLYIVREIARAVGGDAVASERDGGGAELAVRLPLAMGTVQRGSTQQPSSGGAGSGT